MSKKIIWQGLLVVLFIFAAFYLIVRTVFVFYAQYDLLEKILAFLFLGAELFLIFHAFGYFGTLFVSLKQEVDDPKPLSAEPPVAILVPARHEPKEVLRKTFLSLRNLSYKNKTIYLLDDSSDEKYKKEAEELCQEFGLKLFRRTERHGAKAGVINDCLKTLDAKYVAVFDADQCPISTFLAKLIAFLEADPKLAFIQTPQFYSNYDTTRIAFASKMQQAVFYEYICEGKSSGSSMICCGTNVILRREALQEIGGFDETTVTEDFATSLKLHLKGWKTLYYNHVYTFGMAPEDIQNYFKQQFRWANGNITVLKTVIKEFFKNPLALKPWQWFEYFITGSYYLIGWAYTILIFSPILYIFFNVPSFFMNPYVYFLAYVPYFLLSLTIFIMCMAKRNYDFKKMVNGYLLFFISIPIYMLASLYALFGVKTSFQITSKNREQRISYFYFWHQLIIWGLHLTALTWGLNRYLYERTPAILVNTFWVGFHFLILAGIFYFNEDEPWGIKNFRSLFKNVQFDYKIISQTEKEIDRNLLEQNECFMVTLRERIGLGSVLMCKLVNSTETLVFDGEVAWIAATKQNFRALIRPVKLAEDTREKLHKVFLR